MAAEIEVAGSGRVPAHAREPGTRLRGQRGRAAPAGLRRPGRGLLASRLQVPALALARGARGGGGPHAGLLRARVREALLRPLRSRARALPHLPARLPRRVRGQRAPGRFAAEAGRRGAPSLARRRGRGARAGRSRPRRRRRRGGLVPPRMGARAVHARGVRASSSAPATRAARPPSRSSAATTSKARRASGRPTRRSAASSGFPSPRSPTTSPPCAASCGGTCSTRCAR